MKTRMVHKCSECGGESPRWLGRCPACDAWGTLVEHVDTSRAAPPRRFASPAVRCRSATSTRGRRPRADRRRRARPGARGRPRARLGVTLLAGEPGHGQEHAAAPGARPHGRRRHVVPARHRRGVVCAGARSEPTASARSRTGCSWSPRRRCPTSLAHVDAIAPDVLARRLDPDCGDPDLPGAPGSVTQVRDCALPAGPAGQGAVDRHRSRRSCHQGGHVAGPACARARGRHRALVRRRPRPCAPLPPRV